MKIVYFLVSIAIATVAWNIFDEHSKSVQAQNDCAKQLLANPSQPKTPEACKSAVAHAQAAAAMGKAVLPNQ